MSQITHGIRSILAHPSVYDLLQNIMGAQRIRRDLADQFIHLQPGDRVLDIGCGTADILSFLPAGVDYWGYDISPGYIEAARARYGDRGHFECRPLNIHEIASLPRFDVVLAIGVLHHLGDAEAIDLFQQARAALHDRGRMITYDGCLAPGQNPIARFLIQHDRGQNVRTANGYRELTIKSFSRVEGTLRHQTWIPYTHWIMECYA